MSRPLRIEYPYAWYHVMNRARRCENLYTDKDDLLCFIRLMQETVDEGQEGDKRGQANKTTDPEYKPCRVALPTKTTQDRSVKSWMGKWLKPYGTNCRIISPILIGMRLSSCRTTSTASLFW